MDKKFTLSLVLIVSLMLSSIIGYAANINVGGVISASTTWNADTVKVTSNVTVNNGVTLTISAGTYVQFQGHFSLNIQGRLLAQGSKVDIIEFAPLNTSSGWAGIRFDNTLLTNDTSKIYYCRLSYGKANIGGVYEKMGGAVFIKGFSKVELVNNYFSNNYAIYYGGSVYISAASPLFSGNVIVNSTSGSRGGGLYILSPPTSMIMMNNTIANNHSYYNGGVYSSGGTVYLYGSIIWGNTANSYPQLSDDIYCSYSTVEGGFSGSSNLSADPLFVAPASGVGSSYNGLTANYQLQSTSPALDKGYQYAYNYGVIDFDFLGNFRFDRNKIDQGAFEYISSTQVCGSINSNTIWSGHVLVNCNVTVQAGKTLSILPGTKITFTGHYYIRNYGRILASGTHEKPIDFTAWNKSIGWNGFNFTSVSTTNDTSKFEYCNFSYSRKSGYGGVFYIYNSSKFLLRNCVLKNNRASSYGGALYISNGSPSIISNLIINNESGAAYGGGLYIYGSSVAHAPKIYNNTIARNKSTSLGCGLFENSTAAPILRNNIIWDNEDASGNHAAIDNIYPTSGLNLQYCNIEGATYTGTGNISSDPLFKYPTSVAGINGYTSYVNFSLNSTSPCIDTGIPSAGGLSLPSLDINGKTRVYNSRVDMGSYEDKSSLTVCGTISSDQVWDANTININCNVTIADGATVTIIPGTKVLFNGHYKILVKGAIQAIGAPSDTIVFTSANTTTGWDGVQIEDPNASNDSCIFDHCKFEYAKRVPTDYRLGGGALSVRYLKKIRITNSNFTNNTNSGNYAYGSAVHLKWSYTSGALKRVSNNSFSFNTGARGTFCLDYGECIFQGNKVYANTNTNTGAVHIQYGGVRIINNIIANNTGSYGGGMSIQYTYQAFYSRLINNVIVNNTANRGGGIYLHDVKPEIYNNTIANNIAVNGGGMLCNYNADPNLKSNIIYGNRNSTVLNQINLFDVTCDPKIYNCDIQGGLTSFKGSGAGINYTGVNNGVIDVSPGFVSPSSGTGVSYSGMAADWNIAQGSSVINTGFSASNTLDIPNVDFEGNARIYNGRIDMGAYESQDPIVTPCIISSNTVWEADTIRVGCDVTINSGKTLTINEGTNVLFMGHYSIMVDGCIQVKGTSSNRVRFMVNDTTGFYNENITNGGWNGIEFNSVLQTNDSSKFEYCVFTNGKATGTSYYDRYGGAMYIYNSPKVSIENCFFSNNMATQAGGALFIESSNIRFRNNVVVNNSMKLHSTGYSGQAGAIYVDDATMNFENNTIANNSVVQNASASYVYGGGMWVNSSTLIMKNCIVWGNTTTYYSPNNSQIYFNASPNSAIYNSNIEYGKYKVGGSYSLASYSNNMEVDPLFGNPSPGAGVAYDGIAANWTLLASTPLIDKGLAGVQHTSYDISGNPRLVSDTLDMGAIEVQLSRKFITQNPQSKSVCETTSTTFNVGISIATNYQWMHNGNLISGATGQTYTINSSSVSDTGYYYCNMNTSDGSVNSDTAQLGIQFAPVVTTSPTSTSSCSGDSAAFGVGATGTEPLVYTWENSLGQLSGISYGGMKTVGSQISSNSSNGYPSTFANYYWGNRYQFIIRASELTAAGVIAGDISSIAFDVVSINNCPSLSNYSIEMGSTTSTSLNTTFDNSLTTVFSSPSYQPVNGWNTINFVTPYNWNGTSNIIVQICSNNSNNVVGGNASIALHHTSYPSSNYRYANVANVCGYTTGVLNYKRPVIRIKSGANSLQYYVIDSILPSDASVYKCNISNMCGSALSLGAQLTVNSAPSVVPIIGSASVCENQTYTFTTSASGSGPISYQWYKDGSPIGGATSVSHTISSVSSSDDGIYYCKASNACGSDSTNQSVLTIDLVPSIVSAPSNLTKCENQSAMFSIQASGSPTLTYQWYKGGSPVSGGNNSSLLISPVSSTDAGSYYCKVTNSCGFVNSATATLTVNSTVSVTSQSSSQTLCEGSSPTLSITASGTAPITYQWYNNNGLISAATNNTFSITSADTSDAGSYYCTATNSCTSVNSNAISLNVNQMPSITASPQSATVCTNYGAVFTVSADGTGPMSYQWYKGTGAISGATGTSYIIPQVSSASAGSYYVKATNICGVATSQNAGLIVNNNVSITSQSSSTSVCDGASPSFSITASGTAPLTYQWYKNGVVIGGATNNTLSLTSVDTSDDASYYVIATNACNSIQSNNMNLTVNEGPALSVQPLSSVACASSSAMLSVSATGTAPLTYQWYKGGIAVAGGISNTYIIGSSTSSDAGSYYCKVSNACGFVNSNAATLTVNNPAIITAQSGDSIKCVGSSMQFSISATGSAPITYQWYRNGVSILGASSAVYSIGTVATTHSGDYYCIVTNACTSVQSNTKTLTVNTVPAITQQSGDTSICSGTNLTLSIATSGSTPMSYQWYKGSSPIGGAVNSLFPMYQISTSDAATYYCIASNSCGTAQSTPMVITVKSPPTIVYQSADSSRCEGEGMSFIVNAQGTAPLSYQWYKGQTMISGANTSNYILNSVQPVDQGNYYAEISNVCASISTANKYLTVHASPYIGLGNDTSFCDGGSVIIGPGYGYYCVWNNNQIASQLNITISGLYSAQVTDQYGCAGVTDTIQVDVILPYANQEICLVTVDSATGKNVIVWEKTPNMGITSFNVYKESNVSGIFSLLANRPYDSLSVVLDLASNPTVNAERYMITVVDSCNNESPHSMSHRTMHLTINKGQNNDWNLIWNAYEGFTPSSYKVFRADSTLNYVNIATVSGSSSYTYLYTDQNAPITGTVYYYVEVVHPTGGCIATKSNTNYHTSRSNHANSGMFNPTTLVPAFFGTPTSGVFPLKVHFFDQSMGTPTEWEWNFGDGHVDSIQNPTHSYTQIGIYSVSLVVKDATGMNSIAFQNYITVLTTGIDDISSEFDVKVFPNPYTQETNIVYALTHKSEVRIEVFNSIGVKVADIFQGDQMAGSYKYQFRAEDYGFSTGVYYLRMSVDDQLYTKKMVQIK